MPNRRYFLKQAAISGGLIISGQFPLRAFAGNRTTRLTILHTNDVHSRLDPFPMDGSRYQGLGGVARRAALIEKIRQENDHVLLLDAGDIFQGTPYFNLYKGAPDIRAMSMMKYDAATMGNHDFDAGLEGFLRQLPLADFPFLVANYDFSNTILSGKIQTHAIFRKGDLQIGVFGLGIALEGLVPPESFGNTVYKDPITVAEDMIRLLKDKGCHMIICLSHLGYEYAGEKVSDKVLAAATSGIDLIIGGHTHTFLDRPVVVTDKAGKPVLINQVGWAGIRLGRLDFVFDRDKNARYTAAQSLLINDSIITA